MLFRSNDTATTEIYTRFYTLSLHDALPIYLDVVDRALALIDRAEYKRRQAPPGVKMRPKAFGRDWRLPITNRWRG